MRCVRCMEQLPHACGRAPCSPYTCMHAPGVPRSLPGAGLGALTACVLQVFERVARNVVVGAMDGFNGTIFAYGQTGSGVQPALPACTCCAGEHPPALGGPTTPPSISAAAALQLL